MLMLTFIFTYIYIHICIDTYTYVYLTERAAQAAPRAWGNWKRAHGTTARFLSRRVSMSFFLLEGFLSLGKASIMPIYPGAAGFRSGGGRSARRRV